jgi:hypothetical protein
MDKLIALLGLLPLLSLTGNFAAVPYLFRSNPTAAIANEISEFDSLRVDLNWLENYHLTSQIGLLPWISNGVAHAVAKASNLENAVNLNRAARQLHGDRISIQTQFASISDVAIEFLGTLEWPASTTQAFSVPELPFTRIASGFLQSATLPYALRIKAFAEQILRVGREKTNRILERNRLVNNESLLENSETIFESISRNWICLSNRLREGLRGALMPEQTQMLARSEIWSDIQATGKNLLKAKETFFQKGQIEEREFARLFSQADISRYAVQATSANGNAVTSSDKTEIEKQLRLLVEMRGESASNLERFRTSNAGLEETLVAIESDENQNWRQLPRRVVSKWQGELSLRGEYLVLKLGLHGQLKDSKSELVRIELPSHHGSKVSLPDLDEELKRSEPNASRFQKTLDRQRGLGLTDPQEVDANLAQVQAKQGSTSRRRQELGTSLALITDLTNSLAAETANIPSLRK